MVPAVFSMPLMLRKETLGNRVGVKIAGSFSGLYLASWS